MCPSRRTTAAMQRGGTGGVPGAPGWWKVVWGGMAEREPWLALLAPLPAQGGEWTQETRTDPALAGWTQVRLVLGNGVTGLRVLT